MYRVAVIHETIKHASYLYCNSKREAEKLALQGNFDYWTHGAPDRVEVQRQHGDNAHEYKTVLTFRKQVAPAREATQ
jgi:hypothetical protein